jgi:flagellar motor switch protein FliM
MADGQVGVIRRKVLAGRAVLAEGGPGADRGWRLALARAARDDLKLPLEVTRLALDRRSLPELLELPPDLALIIVLEGPKDGLGLLAISAPVLSGMIETLTIGKVAEAASAPRKPTRTDAAMVAGMIDHALAGLEVGLAQEADLIWAGGFRYASFLDDPRPLGLLLEDTSYRVLNAEVSLANGARSGSVLLALPAEGRGALPHLRSGLAEDEADLGPAFSAALAEQVEAADCRLDAVLARLSMPLSRVMGLRVGEVLSLSRAGLDQISFEGIDGRKVAEGKLGQNRGMRAIRLSPILARSATPVQVVQMAQLPEPLRQSA